MLDRFKKRNNTPEHSDNLPSQPGDIYLARVVRQIDLKRVFFIFLGLGLFLLVYYSPSWPDAVDPQGKHFALSREGKAALGLFLLAATWWVFEVIPIGVTSITIGVVQAIFLIRKAEIAFSNFMDPARLLSAWPSPDPASPNGWPIGCCWWSAKKPA